MHDIHCWLHCPCHCQGVCVCVCVLARLVCAQGVVSLKDVAGTIDLCTYHPMALVTLQALMALIGEVIFLFFFADCPSMPPKQKETGRMFQSSGVKLASLFPPSLSSHSAIISLIDARVSECVLVLLQQVPVCRDWASSIL